MTTLTEPAVSSQTETATVSLAVLVVDDMVDLPPIVREWLRRLGHSVRCAYSGREAIALLRREHCDLVITDVLMPDNDGLEVISEAKKAQPGVRILAMSGGGHMMNALDCLKIASAMGAHTMLLKPFTREQLLTAMARALKDEA